MVSSFSSFSGTRSGNAPFRRCSSRSRWRTMMPSHKTPAPTLSASGLKNLDSMVFGHTTEFPLERGARVNNCRARVARGLDRLVVRSPLRQRRVLRRAARNSRPRPVPDRAGRARAVEPALPARHDGARDRARHRRRARARRRLPGHGPRPAAARAHRRGHERPGRHARGARRALRLRIDRPVGAASTARGARSPAPTGSSCARRSTCAART